MTPSAKEGLPAVVGELVAAIDRAQRVSRPLLSPDGGTSFEATVNFVNAFDAIRKTLSALTAEAGKGEVWFTRDVWNAMQTAHVAIIGDAYLEKGKPNEADRERAFQAVKAELRANLALSTAAPAGEWVTDEVAADVLTRYLANSPSGDHWPPERARDLRIASMRDAIRNALAASPRGASSGEG